MSLQQRLQDADIPFRSEIIKGDCGVFCNTFLDDLFLTKTHYFENGSVPVSNIVGSGHVDYQNIFTWGDFLSRGKRIENAIRLAESNPQYYYDRNEKIGMSYVRVGVDYYIQGGNHRSAVAKFLYFLDNRYTEAIHGVQVVECFIDHEAKSLIEALKESIASAGMNGKITLRINRHTGKRGINKNCVIQQYETSMDFLNTKSKRDIHIENITSEKGKNEIQELIYALNGRRWWSSLFSSNKYAKIIG